MDTLDQVHAISESSKVEFASLTAKPFLSLQIFELSLFDVLGQKSLFYCTAMFSPSVGPLLLETSYNIRKE